MAFESIWERAFSRLYVTGTEPDAWLNAQEKEFRILGHEEGQTARQAGTMYV